MHRLTRTEYANTIRDLFPGVAVTTANLPPDIGANGFSKDSAAQTSPINVINAYEATASQVVDSVFATAAAKANLVKCDLATGTACIKSTLQAFLPKAWRRPVQAAEVDRLMTLAATEAAAGSSAEEQLKLVLRAVLMSSKFLYLLEKDPDLNATAPHPVSDYEFASRLSYFIWSSMPDDELFSLASAGQAPRRCHRRGPGHANAEGPERRGHVGRIRERVAATFQGHGARSPTPRSG